MTDHAAAPYGYDPATDTVRVSRHDLARLLLQFRTELERTGAGRYRHWAHMTDYDKSFERLADAVDYGAAQFYRREGERRPDDRMRCKRTAAYSWPERAPYDGRPVEAVHVRELGTRRDRGSHYVTWSPLGPGAEGVALCGFSFAREEGRPHAGEPSCPECVREVRLAAAMPA